jgi:hypothetical protein
MATRHGLIVDAVVALIRESGAVEDRVYRVRGITQATETLPAIDVRPDRSQPADIGADVTRHDFRVRVAVHACEAYGRPPDEIADEVTEQVHRALMADRTLGGACARLRLDVQDWRYQSSGDGVIAVCESVYVAVHATRAADLAVAAA